MPKAFSENERSLIRENLEKAAEKIMQTGEIRKASIDRLASMAGISKGAFYLFFPSKEALFFSVILKKHEEIESALVARLAAFTEPGPAELSSVILYFFRETASSFFPRLLAGGELELLIRRLPPEITARHMVTDEDFLERVGRAVPGLSGLDAKRYSAALRAVFLLLLHRDEIGEESFDGVIELFVESVVTKMFGDCAPAKDAK